MHLPQGNNTPVLDRKYKVSLQNIYFHYNSNCYTYSNYYNGNIFQYSVNPESEINIFFVYDDVQHGVGGGRANMYGNRYIICKAAWQIYVNGGGNSGIWGNSWIIIHELGHNLCLYHTMHSGNGICSYGIEDYCSDTPTREYIESMGQPNPCPSWGCEENTCSNNQMDYSGLLAITPEQLGRVHYTLINNMLSYIDSSSYYFASQNNYMISNNKNITWENNRIFDGGFTVDYGSSLTIKNCWIHIPNDSKIIISNGGTLILENATITNIYNSAMWQGIEMCDGATLEMRGGTPAARKAAKNASFATRTAFSYIFLQQKQQINNQ